MQRDGVTLLVDPLSLQYLMGAEVDYRESLQGAAVRHSQPQRQDAPAVAAAASRCERVAAAVRLPARRPRPRRTPARGRARRCTALWPRRAPAGGRCRRAARFSASGRRAPNSVPRACAAYVGQAPRFLGLKGRTASLVRARAEVLRRAAVDAPGPAHRRGALAGAAGGGLRAGARAAALAGSAIAICGACGERLQLRARRFRSTLRHVARIEHYPRTDPAIIVAVSDGERLLLGRQASWPEKRYSVLAGFVEPGESLEQARGARGDGGGRRADRRLPVPGLAALAVPQLADARFPGRGAPDNRCVPATELEDARWFSAAEIRAQVAAGELQVSPRLSISRWLIDDWLDGPLSRRSALYSE